MPISLRVKKKSKKDVFLTTCTKLDRTKAGNEQGTALNTSSETHIRTHTHTRIAVYFSRRKNICMITTRIMHITQKYG